MPAEAVSNSGPLIHLIQINKFSLLNTFHKIYIPNKVYMEVSASDVLLKRLIDRAKNIERINTIPDILNQKYNRFESYDLDPGEVQAIAYCLESNKNIFLTDDLDAREAAVKLGLEPHGSVGIIVRAFKKGIIKLIDAERSLYDLYNVSNLFVSKTIIDMGIEELKKHIK